MRGLRYLLLLDLAALAVGVPVTDVSARGSPPSAYLVPEAVADPISDLEWSSVPEDSEFQNALPANSRTFGEVEWACTVNRHGRLTNCIAQTEWPKGGHFAEATRPLLEQYRLAPRHVALAHRIHAKLMLTTMLWRQGLPPPQGCPSPFCTPTSPPPPPPPSPQ